MSETAYALGGKAYRRDSGDLSDPATGKHVSRFHGPEVYSPKGTYLGELTQTGRLPNREPDQARPHFPKTRPSKRDRERRRDGRRSPGRVRGLRLEVNFPPRLSRIGSGASDIRFVPTVDSDDFVGVGWVESVGAQAFGQEANTGLEVLVVDSEACMGMADRLRAVSLRATHHHREKDSLMLYEFIDVGSVEEGSERRVLQHVLVELLNDMRHAHPAVLIEEGHESSTSTHARRYEAPSVIPTETEQ